MRTVGIGSQNYTEVICLDEPSHGGACHNYSVSKIDKNYIGNFAVINFQNGPIKEVGVNGCHNEDLIAIVIDRLQHFQAGDYACRDNAIAITKLEEAMMWLNKRTKERQDRGVEGTSEK